MTIVDDIQAIEDEEFARHCIRALLAIHKEQRMKIKVLSCGSCAEVQEAPPTGVAFRMCPTCDRPMIFRELEVHRPTHQEQVKEMMKALDLPLPNEEKPGFKNINFELLRDIVQEEVKEFWNAMVYLQHAKDPEIQLEWWAEVIDAIVDIEFVIHNTSNAMGIDIEPFFQEVLRANMAKAGGPKREDGKALKPEGWQPPKIKEMLEEVLRGDE